MEQRNIVRQGFLQHYVLRSDVFTQIEYRVHRYARLLLKDEMTDQARILRGRKTRVIIDGGANIGFTTRRYLQFFRDAVIYSFEPSPATYEILESNYTGTARVRPFMAALSDVDGCADFYISQNSGASSLSARSDFPVNVVQSVETIRLDTFCLRTGIGNVDILKLDVEGAELLALRGASTLLQKHAIGVVCLEFNIINRIKYQCEWFEIMQYLHSHGYRLFNIYSIREDPESRQGLFGDAIFLSPELSATLT